MELLTKRAKQYSLSGEFHIICSIDEYDVHFFQFEDSQPASRATMAHFLNVKIVSKNTTKYYLL